jgi:hypothetical protein
MAITLAFMIQLIFTDFRGDAVKLIQIIDLPNNIKMESLSLTLISLEHGIGMEHHINNWVNLRFISSEC